VLEDFYRAKINLVLVISMVSSNLGRDSVRSAIWMKHARVSFSKTVKNIRMYAACTFKHCVALRGGFLTIFQHNSEHDLTETAASSTGFVRRSQFLQGPTEHDEKLRPQIDTNMTWLILSEHAYIEYILTCILNINETNYKSISRNNRQSF
jgi:hypothetical protein